MSRGLLVFSLVLVIESSGNTVKGDQCSSYETLDAFVGNCQRLGIKSSDEERWFTLKFHLRYYGKWPYCSLCRSWCYYLASCRRQSWIWRNHCRRKFKYSKHFYITTVPRGEDLPLLEIEVNLCKTKYYRHSRNNDKFFTINITEYKNGMGSIKNVTSPDSDEEFEEEDDLLTKMMKSIQQGDSLPAAVQIFDDQIQQFINESFRTSRNMAQQEKMRAVFLASTALEQFMLDFGQYHLNHTTPQIQFNSRHLDLQLRRSVYQNESEFLLQETKGQNFVRIPAENFHNGSVVLGVMYKNLHEIFLRNGSDTQKENRTRHLNTIIMSATITPRPVTLKENVTLAFRNLEDATFNRKCMFLNMLENSPISWSEQGCRVMSMDNSQTECSCNHMTHFAVLMQFDTSSGSDDDTPTETDRKALEILTYLGLALSSIGIILTILGYVFLTDMKGPLSQIRVSLVTSLGAGQTIFLAGIGATENKGTCVAVAAIVQYFLMAAFCWMLVEGFYLYLFVVKVYNVSNKLKICHGVSWGVPALIVALSLSIAAGRDGVESFVSDEYCWMSSANNLIWIFIVFVVLIELLNILILARVVKEMTKMQQTKDSKTEQLRLGIRACLLLVPLLGLTWLFGLLSPFHKAFAYIFTIFNTTQGFLIFLLHCVRNSEIRARFKRKFHVIFPAFKDDSGINNSTSANASQKKIEVKPSNRNSKLDYSARGNVSLNKIEAKPFTRNNKLEQVKNKLDEKTGGNVSLNKIEIKPSNIQKNSKLEDSANANASLKKTEVKPSDKSSRLNSSTDDKKTDVKPSSRNNKLNGSISANASLKKTEVKPSSKNSKSNSSTSVNASLKNTEVKPSNKINGLNYNTRANASPKKTAVYPFINNSRSNGGGRSRKT